MAVLFLGLAERGLDSISRQAPKRVVVGVFSLKIL